MGCKKCAEEGIPLSDCVCPKEDHDLLRQKICFPPYEAETQTFEAMRRLAPSSRDVQTARRYLKNSGYGEVIYDRYLVNRAGSSNKYYYTSITEKDGKYYPMGAYGRIGALSALFNIKGKKGSPKASCSSMEEAYRYVKEKERTKVNKKGDKAYTDYTLQMAEQFEANNSPSPTFDDGITGQDGPETEPTNATMKAETLAEIEGPTEEATAGGLHSPSSFDMTWEDGSGQSSASIPPNEIAWAEGKDENVVVKAVKTPIGAVFVGTALALLGYSFITGGNLLKDLGDSAKSAVSSAAENRRTGCPTCKDSFNAGKGGMGHSAIPQAQIQDEQTCHANGCRWIPPSMKTSGRDRDSAIPAYCDCSSSTAQAKQSGLQNQRDSGVTFQSEYSVGQINPVEVEGQTDVHGAEQVFTGPSAIPKYTNRPSLKMWQV